MSTLQRANPHISLRTLLRLLIPLARSPFFRSLLCTFHPTLLETLAQGLSILVTFFFYKGARWAGRELRDWISLRTLARALLDAANTILHAAHAKWEQLKANAEAIADLENLLPGLGLDMPGWFDLRVTELTTESEGYRQDYDRIRESSQHLSVKREEFLALTKSLKRFKQGCSEFSVIVSLTTYKVGEKLIQFRREDMLEKYGTLTLVSRETKVSPPAHVTTTAILLELLLAMGPVRFLRRNILRVE